MGVSFPNFVKVVERGKDGFEEAAPYAVALYLPGNISTERGSVDKACRNVNKRMTVYCTGYALEHCGVAMPAIVFN